PVTADPGQAITEALQLLDAALPHPRYAEWADRFTPYDDGRVTERIVDIVFRGAQAGYRVRRTTRDNRRRLLLFLGGMKSNGITSSALNLLSRIDHEKYDVTALIPYFKSDGSRANQQLIDPRVRQVMRIGGMNGSKVMQLRRRLQDLAEAPPLLPGDARWHSKLWRDEWDRVLGSAHFDWVADFSGYSPFWANLLLQSPDAPRAIWLHNEMASDRLRTVGGRRPMERGLGLVFNLYRGYDRLVSVSPRLTAVNREKLADYAPFGRFSTVRNFPSPSAIPSDDLDVMDLLEPGEEVPAWMSELADPEHTSRWFVSVGRLSPEKNHARLIRSFAQVHAQDPSTRLLIVGGGPLEEDLQAQIIEAGLQDAAFLAGRRRLPVALLAASDCFVMSSNYEGQPMVLLEAALCSLPIVSTAFASVADALPDDTIHVVECDDNALRDGMLAYLHGEVPPSRLDFQAYVDDVSHELERVLLATHLDTAELCTVRLTQGELTDDQ
ncbi:MAG: glycosyltransferase, partial [Actinobacteria bacterium]|nr:glycosyltransferase [Actinomycetota bacterium]